MAKNYFADEPMPTLFAPSSQPQSAPQEEQGTFGNAVDSLQAGALSSAGGVFDWLGAQGIAKGLYGYADEQYQQMSQSGRDALSKEIISEDEQSNFIAGEGATDLDTWLLNIANMGGQFLGTAVPGAGLASGAAKVAKLGSTGTKAANIASLGFTGGASATGQGMEQARQEVMQMPDELLAESPIFGDVLRGIHAQKPELSNAEKWDAAQAALAEQVASEVRTDVKTLLANFGASAIGDPIIGKALLGARLAKSGALRSAAKGFVTEGATEAAQAGVQQYGINEALQPIDDRNLMQGVKAAAANEGVIGGTFGGMAGGFGGAINRSQPDAKAEPDPATEKIKENNAPLGEAMESMDQHRTNVNTDAANAQQNTPNYDQPTAARNAGFTTDAQAGAFGDMLNSPSQESLRNMRAQTVADMVRNAAQFTGPTPEDRFSPIKYQHEGELLPAAEQASKQKGELPGATFEGELQIPTNQLAQANPVPAIENKNIIFAADETGVNVKRSGEAFKSTKEALSSKGARKAKRQGLTIEAVPFDNGFGWRVLPLDQEVSNANNDTTVDSASASGQGDQPQAGDLASSLYDGPSGLPTQSQPAEGNVANGAETAPVADGNAIANDPLIGAPIDEQWTSFSEQSGTKRIARADMPQIKAEHRGALVQFLKGRDIAHEQLEVDAQSLKPTQLEFSPGKVQRAKEYEGGERSILVSNDGHVLDGHHQWLAAREQGEPVKVIKLDAPIEQLLPLAHEFPSSEVDGTNAILEGQEQPGSENDSAESTLQSEQQGRQQADITVENNPAPTEVQGDKTANVQNREVERVTYSGEPVNTPEEAASAVASIRKKAQEQMTAIVTDGEGNVLNIVRHTLGTPNSASVSVGVLSGAILDTPNAKNVWFAHNHPSGKESQSEADRSVTRKLKELMDGSGVDVKGMLALGSGDKASFYDVGNRITDRKIQTQPAVRKSQAPVTERKIIKRDQIGDNISSPQEALVTAKQVSDGRAGVLFLNQQNDPIKFEPLTYAEMAKLREGKLADILKNVHRANAISAIIVTTDDAGVEGEARDGVENTSTMLETAGLNVLDVIDAKAGDSLASRSRMPRTRATFYRSDSENLGDGVKLEDAHREFEAFIETYKGLDDGFRAEITDKKPSELFRGADLDEREDAAIKGGYDKETDTLFVFAQNHSGISDLQRTLREELLVHKGLGVFEGQEISELLSAINKTRKSKNKQLQSYWQNVLKNYANEGEIVQAEELLGKVAQEKPNLFGKHWNNVLAALRKLLRKFNLVDENITLSEMRAKVYEIGDALAKGRRATNSDYNAQQAADSGLFFNRDMDAAGERTAKEKLGLAEQAQETLAERAKERTKETVNTLRDSSFWKRLNEGIFDGLSGIKQAEESVGVVDPNQQGYVSARLASGLSDVLHGVFNYGAPQWKDGIVQRKEDTKGLLEVFAMLGDDLNDWLAWMGAHRAEKLKAQGRENNLTQTDIDELKALADGKEEQFEQVRKEYNKINSAILDLAQEAGLLNKQQRKGFDEDYYVPFFRDLGETDAEMDDIKRTIIEPHTRKGIAGQSAKIKELKGGKQSTKDLLENIITRQSTLIDAAMKNKAMVEVTDNLAGTDYMQREDNEAITQLSQQELNKLHKVKVMRDGKAEAYMVSDPALLRGLLQVNDVGKHALFNRLSRRAKQFLTAGITLSPDFIFRNFVRDAAHAWMINKDDFKFGTDSIKGLKKAFKEDEAYRDLIFSGAAFQGGYIHGADPEAAAQQTRRALRKKGLTKQEINSYMDSIVDSGAELLEKYRGISDKVENANRLSTYESALAAGKSKRQAAFEAKDLMDYSLKGNFGLIGTMIDMLPFFNARLQGMSKLVRAARAQGDDQLAKVLSQQLAMKGMKVAAFSLALAALNDDDERYQELADWDKDANWHFFVGDDHFRIPKPFELGIIFGTLPERMLHFGTGSQNASDLGKSVGHAVFNTLALNPIPQFALPMTEVMVNRSFFKDAPIEGMSDANKQAQDRYNAYTSDTAKLLGDVFNTSPKKIEHLIKGYTGTIGGYVLGASDILAQQMLGLEKPDTPISRYPVIKSFYQGDGPRVSTKFASEFYDAMDAANQAYGSYKRALEEGDQSRAQELLETDGEKLRTRVQINRVQRQLRKLNKQAEVVNNSKSLDGTQKRDQLDAIQRQKNTLYQRAYVMFNLGEW